MLLRQRPIAWFLGVTFAVSWGAWLALAAAGGHVGIGFSPIYVLGLCGPLVGAFVASARVAGTSGVRALLARMVRVRVGARWWAIALGLPLGVAAVVGFGALLIATFGIGHTPRDFGAFSGFPHTSPVVLWLLLVAVGGLGGETGWRGYLLPHLERRWSPAVASLAVGAVWAVWQLPALLLVAGGRAMPPAMLFAFFTGVLAASVVTTWLYNRGRSSILLVAVFYGTYLLMSGTLGARGLVAALETSAVMLIAAVLLASEARAVRAERHGRAARHAMAIARRPPRDLLGSRA